MSYGNGQDPPDWAPSSDALDTVADPEDYASLAEVRELYEKTREVLARRGKTYEAFWDGRFSHQDRLKAFRMAVEDLLLVSEPVIRSHSRGRWYWQGEPPAFDSVTGESVCPFERDGDGYVHGDDGQPKLRAYHPDQGVPLPDGGKALAGEVAADGGLRLNRPILLTDDYGRPPFGTGLNKLGKLRLADDGVIEFVGLEDIIEAPDPIVYERERMDQHPQRLLVKERETESHQIPEKVLMNAFRLCRRFWQREAGLGFSHDRGLPRQTGANFATGEKGRVEHGDPH